MPHARVNPLHEPFLARSGNDTRFLNVPGAGHQAENTRVGQRAEVDVVAGVVSKGGEVERLDLAAAPNCPQGSDRADHVGGVGVQG